MAFSYRVYVAWNVNAPAMPAAADWTRIDVSNPVSGLQTKRRVDPSFFGAEIGDAVISISNQNGWLDPQNTASPYTTKIRTWVPIRIEWTDGVTTADIFNGFVVKWPQSWEGNASWGVLELTDVLGWIARQQTPSSELERAVMNSAPYLYYPGRYKGETPNDAVIGAGASWVTAKPFRQDQSILPFDAAGSTAVDATVGGYFSSLAAAPDLPLTIQFALRTPKGVDSYYIYCQVRGCMLAGDSYTPPNTFGISGRYTTTAAGTTGGVQTPSPGDAVTHLYHVVFDASGVMKIYRDGTWYGNRALTGGIPAYSSEIRWGLTGGFGSSNGGQQYEFSHFAVWDKELPDADKGNIWRAATTGSIAGSPAELTQARLTHWLDLAGVPASRRDLVDGPIELTLATRLPEEYRKDLLSRVRDTALADDSPLWVGVDGKIKWRGRIVTQPAPVYTFTGADYKDARYELTDDMLVTSVTTKLSTSGQEDGDTTGTTYELTAQPEGEHHIDAPGSGVWSSLEAIHIGEGRVRRGTLRRPRIEALEVMPAKVGLQKSTLDIGQGLTVVRKMPWGAQYTESFMVTGVEHTLPDREVPDGAVVKYEAVPMPVLRRYLFCYNATAGVRASTPMTQARMPTGDMDIKARLSPGSQAGMVVAGQWPTSWGLYVSAGQIVFVTANGVSFVSPRIPGLTVNWRPIWIRATYIPTLVPYGGAAQAQCFLYWSDDGVTWTFASAPMAAAAYFLPRPASPAPVAIGAWDDGSGPMNGNIFEVHAVNAINAGPTFFDMAPVAGTSTTWTQPTTGDLWTANSSLALIQEY